MHRGTPHGSVLVSHHVRSGAVTCSSAGGHHSHGHDGVMEVSEPKSEVEAALSASGKHEHSHEQLHACIGVSLVLGFVFMLLVDQIGSAHMHSTEGWCYKGEKTPMFLTNDQYVGSESLCGDLVCESRTTICHWLQNWAQNTPRWLMVDLHNLSSQMHPRSAHNSFYLSN